MGTVGMDNSVPDSEKAGSDQNTFLAPAAAERKRRKLKA
jgi:hypothetical protein